MFPTFQHEGMEFLYMLEGEVVYRHGGKLYRMKPGDSLFFDADAPHGPEELTQAADALSLDHLLSAKQRGLTSGVCASLELPQRGREIASVADHSVRPEPADVAVPSSYFDSQSTTRRPVARQALVVGELVGQVAQHAVQAPRPFRLT